MKPINELTKEELFSDDVIQYILNGESQTDCLRRAQPYIEKARALRCTAEFKNIVKSAVDEKKRAIIASSRVAMANMQNALFDLPDGNEYLFSIPSWTVDERGIYRINEGNGTIRRASYRPVFIKKVLRNAEDGREKVKLCFQDGNKHWLERIFDRLTISSASKITQLSSYGVDVTTETCKALVEFLYDMENNNLGSIERGISTSRFGWKRYNGELKFIPYDTEIEFDANEQFATLADSIQPKGKYKTWLEVANRIRKSGRKEPLVYLIASFSSVLVQPLGLLPYIVNLWTETGKGKTVALMFACSVWGNPEEGHYLSDPTSTRTALERRCTALNNLPLMIDDLSKMKDGVDIDFTSMIYFLCGGKGKERSNVELGMEVVGSWKNCILTNMERPLATETMRGGAVNRILDFQSEEGSYFMFNGRDRGREIVKNLKENYGFAGRDFVELLKQTPVQTLKEKFEGYVTKIKDLAEQQGTAKEEKQIAPMAALFLTDELIEEHIFKDGVRLDLEWCVNQLKDVDTVSENQRAYEDLISTVFANIGTHFNKDVHTEQWGYVDEYNRVWLLPTAFRRIAAECNFSTTALLNWALKHNYLYHDNEKGRVRLTKKKRESDTKAVVTYYVFKLPEDNRDITAEFEDLTPEEKANLPFT